jgi:hypothetical protein
MSLSCSWNFQVAPATVVVASSGALHVLLQEGLSTACSACGERSGQKQALLASRPVRQPKGVIPSCKKRFELRGSACTAWRWLKAQWTTDKEGCAFLNTMKEEQVFLINAAKEKGCAFAPEKRLVPTGIVCLACSAWRQKWAHWHQMNLNVTIPKGMSDESDRSKHWPTALIRMACEQGPQEAKACSACHEHAVCIKACQESIASGYKCVLVTRHTWEECECLREKLLCVNTMNNLSPGVRLCRLQGPF